jgi:hypothetical protein
MTGGQNYLPPWLERRNDLTVREYKNIVKSNTHPCKRFLEAPTNTIYFLAKAKIRHFRATVSPRERFVTIETTWKATFKSCNCKFTIIQTTTILKKLYSVLAILINLRRQKIAADISKFGGNFCHYKLTLWQRIELFYISILLTLLIKSVWYSRKPCFIHNNIETSYQSFSFNFVTLQTLF